MTSAQDIAFGLAISSANNQITQYFSYTMPWLTIGCNLVALSVLYFRKRIEQNIVIFIFKWQYLLGILYALNMLTNENQFSQTLFKYVLTENVSDPVCKLRFLFLRFIYCLSPWMQVVLSFFFFFFFLIP